MTDIMKLADKYAEGSAEMREILNSEVGTNETDQAIERMTQQARAALQSAIEALIAERDAYQQAADKMAAEHKVEREALERQIKIKDGEAEMYKSYWKQATDANRKIRNVA